MCVYILKITVLYQRLNRFKKYIYNRIIHAYIIFFLYIYTYNIHCYIDFIRAYRQNAHEGKKIIIFHAKEPFVSSGPCHERN